MSQARELAEFATAYAGGNYGMRNRIINGNMVIAQRATSVSAHSGGGYTTLDRWNLFQNLGAMNIAQSSTAPTGFSNSMQFTVSTAASQTSSSTSVVTPNQSIEGFNTADLMWGTANAKTITVSVWVYSSLIGQYAIWIRNGAGDRYYATPFTITTANTWQQVTATIAGDTSGTWVGASNGIGLTVGICLAAGSDRVGAGNTWSSSTFYGVTGQVDWQATASNTFYFTGFQLEAGSVATPFERRPYGTELALCQRYFYKKDGAAFQSFADGMAGNTTFVVLQLFHPVEMRTAPSIAVGGTLRFTDGNNTLTPSAITNTQVGRLGGYIVVDGTGLTQFRPYNLTANNDATAFLSGSAEL
jgi:hypothetical protein